MAENPPKMEELMSASPNLIEYTPWQPCFLPWVIRYSIAKNLAAGARVTCRTLLIQFNLSYGQFIHSFVTSLDLVLRHPNLHHCNNLLTQMSGLIMLSSCVGVGVDRQRASTTANMRAFERSRRLYQRL